MHVICHLREHIYVASNFCYVNSDAQFRSDIQLPYSWATFSGDISCLSPTTTRTTHFWVTTSFLSLNSKHGFCYIYSDAYSAHTFRIALTVATHIPLRHLATIIPSQLNNYLLPSFLPSYETCSIKVPFILTAIKLSWKPYGIFVLLSFISHNIARI